MHQWLDALMVLYLIVTDSSRAFLATALLVFSSRSSSLTYQVARYETNSSISSKHEADAYVILIARSVSKPNSRAVMRDEDLGVFMAMGRL